MPPRNLEMQIDYLADHLEFAPVLAAWHYAQWAELMPEWSHNEALAELQSHAERRKIPTTLVALEDGRLLGSVSLLTADLAGWEHLSPWLASVFVIPDRRGEGVGTRLIRRAIEEARELGVRALYLFTAGHETYYQRLGWRRLALAEHVGRPLAIMEQPIAH